MELKIAKIGHMQIHRRRVAARVKPVIRRAKFQRHEKTITRIMRGSAHLRRFPILSHMFDPQRAIGLKAATGQDNSVRKQPLLRTL